jgi:predicted membrane protein
MKYLKNLGTVILGFFLSYIVFAAVVGSFVIVADFTDSKQLLDQGIYILNKISLSDL